MNKHAELMTKDDFIFFHPLRVRWAEVDGQGIVFNPNYLVYVDIAITEYMRAAGFPYPGALSEYGSDVFVVNSELNYRGSAVFDQDLDIGTRISRFGRTSMTFMIGIFGGDALLCDVRLTYVNGDKDTKKPMPIPEPFIDAILKFEKTSPDRG